SRVVTTTQPTQQTRSGSRTTTLHRTLTYSCPTPVGAYTTTTPPWGAPTAPYGPWVYTAWSSPAPYGASTTTATTWGTTSNTCTSCPTLSPQTQTQWVASSAACPSGQTGSHTWEREQSRSRTRSYNCPAGTTSLPPVSYGAYS